MKQFTKKSTFLYGVLIVGVTLLILYIFVNELGGQDRDRHTAINYLRQTTELQHRLQEVILEAHAFRSENYDSIVEVTKQIESFCPAIEHLPEAFLFAYNPQIATDLHRYCVLNEKTLLAVERFKSKNSLLQNSIKYLPVITDSIVNEHQKNFALHLYSDTLLYCLQPTSKFKSQIEAELLNIPNASRANSIEKDTLAALQKHIRLILQSASDRSRLEEEIFTVELKQAVGRISDGYITATDKLERKSYIFKTFAILFSAALLFGLLYLLFRLQVSAESLSELNLTLENKVDARTHELKMALLDLEVQQEFIAHTAKMSALGEMAGGVAHEINTPLAAISLKAETLLLGSHTPQTEKTLNEIISIVERVAKIVLGLRTFSRSSNNDAFQSAIVKTIIEDTLILCAQKFTLNNVSLDVNVSSNYKITCSPEQISQVVLNLLNNSFDAVAELPEKWVRIDATDRDGKLILSVTDSGSGISESVRAKIMQPFFTTKGVGKGTGIGLSISQGIIAKHSGELKYDSSSANTSFVITIPLIAEVREVA